MKLSDYFEMLDRRKWVIILTTLAAVGAFLIGWTQIPPNYEASATLRVMPYSVSEPPYTQLIYADRIMNTYVQIATSNPILEDLRKRLSLRDDQPADISVEIIPSSELLQIKVSDPDPILARDAANTLAEILINERSIRDIRVDIVDPAVMPESNAVSKMIIFGSLALVLGLTAGIGLAILLENLDTRLYTAEQIEDATKLSVFGEIPATKINKEIKLPFDASPFNDSFRRIRINILRLAQRKSFQTFLITSAEPDEGKSTIVANLACSLEQTGCKVIVVDMDMHRPTIHQYFNLTNEAGLSDVLAQDKTLAETLRDTPFSGVKVLTSGPSNDSSAELLGTRKMQVLLDELKKKCDVVLLDTPAFLGVADTAIIAQAADAVVLVTRSEFITKPALDETSAQLKLLGSNLIGVIVNRVNKNHSSGYYKYYHRAK